MTELGCSPAAVRDGLLKHNIPIRRDKHPSPTVDMAGYVVCRNRHKGTDDTVFMHRLLAVAKYGYELTCENVVHHKNHIPWANWPGNIELQDDREHAKYHANVQRGNRAAEFAEDPRE